MKKFKEQIFDLNKDFKDYEEQIDVFMTNLVMLDADVNGYPSTTQMHLQFYDKTGIMIFEVDFWENDFRIITRERRFRFVDLNETFNKIISLLLEG